jgi:hypothetical protein
MNHPLSSLSLLFVLACGTGVPVFDGVDGGDGGLLADGATTQDSAVLTGYFRLRRGADPTIARALACESGAGARQGFTFTIHHDHPCAEFGPVRYVVDAAAREVIVTPTVWEHLSPDGECDSNTMSIGSKQLYLDELTAGDWRVLWDNGSWDPEVSETRTTLWELDEFSVRGDEAIPPLACTSPGPLGSTCLADCDCSEGICADVIVAGGTECGSRECARPCSYDSNIEHTEYFAGCPARQVCGEDRRCHVPSIDLCARDAECPPGMRCETDSDAANVCVWDIELNEETRRLCNDNSECDPGFDCVAFPSTPDPRHQRGRCEVRCRSSEQTCPDGYWCDLGYFGRDEPVVCHRAP